MFNIVLFEPEIPPNTGNIIRLCANTGCTLHLIEPLGFKLEEKQLRRAGLDYHALSCVKVHTSWQAFLAECQPAVIYALSTKGQSCYAEQNFKAGDYLLFGPETRGLPDSLLSSERLAGVLRIPMQAESRSLNLSNSVALCVYEAWRQHHFQGST